MYNKKVTLQVQQTNHALSGNSSGFSLIELMIAMAILAFGMLAAASLQYSAIRNNTRGSGV